MNEDEVEYESENEGDRSNSAPNSQFSFQADTSTNQVAADPGVLDYLAKNVMAGMHNQRLVFQTG